MKKSIGKRLEILRDDLRLTNLSLAEAIKTDNSTVGKIIKGVNNLTNAMLMELYSKYQVNINWLITGNGDMYNKKSDIKVSDTLKEAIGNEIEVVRVSLNKLEKALQDAVQKQTESGQATERLPLGKKASGSSPLD